jgi:hypothetical protein
VCRHQLSLSGQRPLGPPAQVVLRERGWTEADAAALLRHAPSSCLRSLKLSMCRTAAGLRPGAAARLEALLLAWLRRCGALRTLKLRGASLAALRQLAAPGSASGGEAGLAHTLRELWFGEVLKLPEQRGGLLRWLPLPPPLRWLHRVEEARELEELLGLGRRLAGLRGLRVLRLKDYSYVIGQSVKQELHAELRALLPGCVVWLQIG